MNSIKCLVLLLIVKISFSYRFLVTVNEDIEKCKNGLPTLDEFVDLTNLEITKPEEDLLVLNGHVTFLADLQPGHKAVIKSAFSKKQGGFWMPVPVVNFIPDFCAVEFDSKEMWYPMTKNLQGDARKCPPPKGVTTFNS